LILDVLPTRHIVIDWYKRLGFAEIAPYEDLPMPMVFLAKRLDHLRVVNAAVATRLRGRTAGIS
jgi:hypothetical protein